jgi:hypothetical protein
MDWIKWVRTSFFCLNEKDLFFVNTLEISNIDLYHLSFW